MNTGDDHESFRADVPEAARGTLPEDRQRRLEVHAAGCAECAGVLEVGRQLAGLEPHPALAELRAHALARGPAAPAVAGHVERCASCALEVSAWRAGRKRRGPAIAIGAGLLAAGLACWVWLGGAQQGEPGSAGLSPGPAQELLFSPALRASDAGRVVEADPRRDLLVRAEWESLEPIAQVGAIGLAIRQAGGGTVVWSAEFSGERVAEILRGGGGFQAVVPAGTLAGGEYDFTLSQVARPDEPPLILEHFTLRAPAP